MLLLLLAALLLTFAARPCGGGAVRATAAELCTLVDIFKLILPSFLPSLGLVQPTTFCNKCSVPVSFVCGVAVRAPLGVA